MTLTDKHIEKIAALLDCGLTCYFHRPTGTIEYHPDLDSPYHDPESWEEVHDKLENDRDNYDRFEKMDSNEGFELMENFAYSLTDENFRNEILTRLSGRKPFRNFKILIDSSDYRQDWFDFKKKAYIEFVKDQIEENQ